MVGFLYVVARGGHAAVVKQADRIAGAISVVILSDMPVRMAQPNILGTPLPPFALGAHYVLHKRGCASLTKVKCLWYRRLTMD